MHDERRCSRAPRCIVRRVTPASLGLLGLALIGAACSSAHSVATFNSQANGICGTYSSKLRTVDPELALSNNERVTRLKSSLSNCLPLVEQGTAKLQGLGRPGDEAGALKKVFTMQTAQVSELENLQRALDQGNTSKIQSTETAVEESEAPLNQQFDALGMTGCGSGSTPS